MGHCSRCGQQLIEGMAFCGHCGAAVAQPQAQESLAEAGSGEAGSAEASAELPKQQQPSAAGAVTQAPFEMAAGPQLPPPGQQAYAAQSYPPPAFPPPAYVAPPNPQQPYGSAPYGNPSYGSAPYVQPGVGPGYGPGYGPTYNTGYNPTYNPAPAPDAVGQAPQFAFRLPITTQDALQWLRGGAILAVVTLVSGFVLAALIGLLVPGQHHGNPADWFSAGFLIAGMALGGRVGVSGSSFDAGDGTFNESFDLRISALIVTVVVLLAVRVVGRRSEQRHRSSSLRSLTIRALGTGLVYTVLLALLALAVHIHSLYGASPFGGVTVDGSPTLPGAQSVGSSAGALVLSASSLFLWPLVLTVVVLWGSAFAVWLRVGATSAADPAAARLAWLWTCRPAFLAVRAQVIVTSVLAGVGVFVYAVIELQQHASGAGLTGSTTARIVAGLLLGLPNLGALAGTVSLGASLTGFGPFESVLGVVGNIDPTNIDPNSTGASPYTSTLSVADANSFGFFGGQHPALVYLLIAASVLGTLGAAKWAVGKSWDRSRALLGPGQAWRGAVVGALLWVVVGFAAQLMENTSVMDMGTTLDIGPSMSGLLLAGAVWGTVTCLAMSYFAGHLTATPIAPTGPSGPSGPSGPVNYGQTGPAATGAYGTGSYGTGSYGTGAYAPGTYAPGTQAPGTGSFPTQPAPAAAPAPVPVPINENDDVVDMGTVITLGTPDPDEE